MSTAPSGARLPLTLPRAVSTFSVALLGLMTANLVPLMIVALMDGLGLSATAAGSAMTACLLTTAVVGLGTARLTEGRGRYLVGRAGLGLAALGFGIAALAPSTPLTLAAIVLAGAGCGGAVSAGGAALAALHNPDRMAGINGLVNRGVVTVVLMVIPLLGGGMLAAFGVPALLCIAALLTVGLLPPAPSQQPGVGHAGGTAGADAGATAGVDADTSVGATHGESARLSQPAASGIANASAPGRAATRGDRLTALAGMGLLIGFAVWALGEDSLWAMAGAMGADQAGITDAQMGLVLSASTAGGLLASLGLIWVGSRLGRAVPLAVLLLAGSALKIASGQIHDPAAYIAVIIAWNTIYAMAFMFVVSTAAGLDANGRWNAPLQGAYLLGSGLSPLFGAWLSERIGYAGMGWVLGCFSLALTVPFFLMARRSTQVEREQAEEAAAGPDVPRGSAGAARPAAGPAAEPAAEHTA